MIDITNLDLDLNLELNKYDNIKNSKYYNIIKDKKMKELDKIELKEFKSFLLSLNEDEIILIIVTIIDNEYAINNKNNKYLDRILNCRKLNKYTTKIIKMLD